MSSMSKNQDGKIRYVKALLNNYNINCSKVKIIESEIKLVENNYNGVGGISYENSSSKTNKISSLVENEIIKREYMIENLHKEIRYYQIQNQKIDIALGALTPDEQELIKLKFFEGYRNNQIAGKLYLHESFISHKLKKIILKIADVLCVV